MVSFMDIGVSRGDCCGDFSSRHLAPTGVRYALWCACVPSSGFVRLFLLFFAIVAVVVVFVFFVLSLLWHEGD